MFGLAESVADGIFWRFEANIAQLVEQRFRKAWVVGSIPTVGSTTPSELLQNTVRNFVCCFLLALVFAQAGLFVNGKSRFFGV